MQAPRIRRLILLVALAVLTAGAIEVWWQCDRSDTTAFLPASPGAQWILDDTSPENKARYAFPIHTVFKREFTLAAAPDSATITLRAFRSANVTVNGQPVNGLQANGRHWKSATSAEITTWLHAGTNEIAVTVTNNLGPAALWLRLQAGTFSLGSDESWLASPVGSHWFNARRASLPPVLPDWSPLASHNRAIDSLRKVWRVMAVFAALSLVLIFGCSQALKNTDAARKDRWIYLLLAVIFIARGVLFIHNDPALPHAMGFDATDHEDYVKFIQTKEALPLPNDGWEMHQPPLYYLGSAIVMNGLGYMAGQENSVLPLRAVNGVIGLLHCWLVLLCLRRLFPGNHSAQAVGLLVAGVLPAGLYPSFYVTNDPLTGLFVTLAVYFFLRILDEPAKENRFYAGIGLALGAAVLTKLSALLAIPVFLAALSLRLLLRPKFAAPDWIRSGGIVLLVCLLTCGWHYVRVWIQIGALPLPNSQTDAASAWWQDPGFRTASYYAGFGRSLDIPMFSACHSFADGIYSTLWGDGLISGCAERMFRPPWNFDLMNASCLLALGISLLAGIGFLLYARDLIRRPEPITLLLPGMILAFAGGIFMLTLHGAWLAHVKAFYALPALVPFCALIVTGWLVLARKNPMLRTGLWAIVLIWIFTTYTSFWIHGDDYEVPRNRAIVELANKQVEAAFADISRAVQLNPTDADCHYVLGAVLVAAQKPADGIAEYVTALQLAPDSPRVLDRLAQILATGQPVEVERAARLAAHACELTHYRQADYVSTLADVYAKLADYNDAIAAAEIACELARQGGDASLERKNRELLEACRAHKTAGSN